MASDDAPQTIGILGGMGHAAAGNLFEKMIGYAQRQYHAVQDEEYPPIILHSLPLAGFDETGVADEQTVRTQLMKNVMNLQAAGADVITIACNTVHIYFEELQAAVSVPIINMVEETMQTIQTSEIVALGLFCSETTARTHLYQTTHRPQGMEILEPNAEQQRKLNLVIEHVMGGQQDDSDVELLQSIATSYREAGAEGIILGCTEIPLAISAEQLPLPTFDATEVLAQRAVDMAMSSH